MLRSVKIWLTLLFVGVVLTALAIAYAAIVPPLADRLADDKLDNLEGSSDLVARTITNELNQSPSIDGRPIIDEQALTYQAILIDNQINARIVVINANSGQKMVDSRSVAADQARRLPPDRGGRPDGRRQGRRADARRHPIRDGRPCRSSTRTRPTRPPSCSSRRL